jgi:glycosyltransferase involved in cell wall biosynthesis
MESRRIKIAFITTVMDKRGGKGTAVAARELVNGISKENDIFEVTFIHHEEVPDPLYEKHETLVIPHLSSWLDRQAFREAVFWIRMRREGRRFDVVHFLSPRTWPAYLLCPADSIVIQAYEAGVMRNLHDITLADRIFRFTNRFLNWRMSAVIATSQFGKEEIVETYNLDPARVPVIPLGVDGRFLTTSNEKDVAQILLGYGIENPYILSISRFAPHKNVLRLVQAFRLIASDFPRHTLVLAGGAHLSGYSQEVRDAIEQEGLSGRVVTPTFISEEHLPLVYQKADLFVYPSLHEGFGLPILEAMASGAPVATSNTTACGETAGDAAALFDPKNITSIADAMRKVLTNTEYQADLIKRGKERAHTFTWARSVDSLIAIYKQITASVT